MQRCNRKENYCATAFIQNEVTLRVFEEKLIEDCKEEYSFMHYMQAFYFPIQRMRYNSECFSYMDFLMLKEMLFSFFPDFNNNSYLDKEESEEMDLAKQLLNGSVTEEELRRALYESERYLSH